ncbi:MAG TPA: SDR family NAD(P)-dependent oxidoreductase [Solirubrobacteraceae bacterium]|nr:SDR family NAD(P)-dependent oxidoreductase [Solirubrobacteraceae bacterium]
MTNLLITGATRGLGLAAAHAAAARGAHVLVAGRSPEAVRATATAVGGEPIVLDLERLADVQAVAQALPAVEAVALNAGVQVVTGASRTPDGFETTFQVNHLAHLLLLDALLARSEPPARVVLVGSGTHDPSRRTGMPAPLEGDVGTWARADDGEETPGVAGRRRYTTSKLLNAATAAALAREHPNVHVTCFDPGLMLGTGLSRQYPAVVRRLTTVLAPALGMLLPFASTPQSSGRALARLLLEVPAPAASGAYVDHRLRTLPASERARDAGFQAEELRDSRALLALAVGRERG